MPVWNTHPVNEQPELTLKNWSTKEIKNPLGHAQVLVGYCLENREGRTSRPVVNIDLTSMRVTTESGRVYQLIGPPGHDLDAEYVFRRWCHINEVSHFTDVSADLWRAHLGARASRDPSEAPFKKFLQQDDEITTVVKERLQELGTDVGAAAIFGSIARGEESTDSDIDVLLVTADLSRLAAQAHFKPTGRQLGRPVNVLVYTPHAWVTAVKEADPLVNDILSNPLVMLKGTLPTPLV